MTIQIEDLKNAAQMLRNGYLEAAGDLLQRVIDAAESADPVIGSKSWIDAEGNLMIQELRYSEVYKRDGVGRKA